MPEIFFSFVRYFFTTFRTVCLLLCLTNCTSVQEEKAVSQPHQNTIVKPGGTSDVQTVSDSSWVHSSAWLYGEVAGLELFSVHPDGSGLHIIGRPKPSLVTNMLISPQRKQIFYGTTDYATYGYWLYSTTDGQEKNISQYIAPDAAVSFSPDWTQLAWTETSYTATDHSCVAVGSPHVSWPVLDPRSVYVLNIARGALAHFTLQDKMPNSNFPFDLTWSNDGKLVLFERSDAENHEKYWAINPQSGAVMQIGDKAGPGMFAQAGTPGAGAEVTYFDGPRKIGATYGDGTTQNQPESGRYTFADGAVAYMDANSNLVVQLPDGKIIDVQPSVVIYFPWTPPPAPGSGVSCDCGMPGGVEIAPDIQGVVDGNYLIYRWGPNQQTWIFGLKEHRKSPVHLPFGSTLLF